MKRLFTLDEELRFGKYKGCTLRQIIDSDPEYVTWGVDNSVLFLDNEAYSYYVDHCDT